MNSKSESTFEELLNEAEELLGFKTKEDKRGFDKDVLQLEIMNEVERLMVSEGLSRKDLADKLGISKSFISQLFSCDKKLHFGLLAQLQEVFKCKLNFSFIPYSEYSSKMVIADYKNSSEKRYPVVYSLTDKTDNEYSKVG